MRKRSGFVSVLALLLALVTLVLAGCGGGSSNNGGSNNGGLFAPSAIEGNDVFQGQRFNEMLWSYYEADCYEYTGANEDAAAFLEGMNFMTIETAYGEDEIATMPVSVQFGLYSHFTSAFTYEDKFYQAYTEKGKAMFRKAYMEEYGELTEETFQKIEELLQLCVAELVIPGPTGTARYFTFAYEVKGNQVCFYELEVDDDYNVIKGEEPVLTYDFLLTGGELILRHKGVERTYLTSGYKPTDSAFVFSGYALNGDNRYGDLDGFSMFQYSEDEEITVYVDLTNDESPIDPVMTMDKKTGNFTLSWQQRWVTVENRLEKQDDPTTISGTIVPCTSYGFTDYSGFFMFVDGQMYRYLMSEEEYAERKESAMIDAENLSSSQKEDLATAKRNLLAELAEAFRQAGIEVKVDFVSGKIDLEANFLFDTGSYELSQEGKDYINAFMGVYSSVVMKPDYAEYLSNIIVEGHTDTSGSYSLNMTLSQNRADAVAAQCVAHTPAMADVIKAVGYAYDYPVYNDDGTVNMEKSRRVTFSFLLNAK